MTDDSGKANCYVARHPDCGKLYFATVDKPEFAKDNAKELRKLMADGIKIESMTVAEVRQAHWCDCKRKRTVKAKQETLL